MCDYARQVLEELLNSLQSIETAHILNNCIWVTPIAMWACVARTYSTTGVLTKSDWQWLLIMTATYASAAHRQPGFADYHLVSAP